MEYTVNKLAGLAGVSARTLRYYDQIGLLKPCRISGSGYRIYGQAEVDRLQQILFFRALGIGLEEIEKMINAPDYDVAAALTVYREELVLRQKQLTLLIRNVEKTIEAKKGIARMSDIEKFEGLKARLIEENERKYGAEVRQKYGEEIVRKSNERFGNLSQADFEQMEQTGKRIREMLEQAVLNGADPTGETGREIAALHKTWLGFTWPNYSPEAHAGLVQMYVDDERFTQHYDNRVNGCAKFLRDAVTAWLRKENT